MAKWKRAVFIIVLVAFIGLSVFFTFYAIARDTFEFEYQENVGDIEGLDGYVFYGFSGNTATTDVTIDYVRDEDGENPDETKPIVGIDDFTMVSDEYVEFITIGKDVQYISEQAFYYCKMLKAVFVDEENQWYTSVDGVLYTKDMKTLVLHPICNSQWLVDEGVLETADTYDIPEGVETVGGYSFYKNLDLVHLTFPSTLKSIGDMAFFGCNNMWSIWFPEGLESIGADAFSYCWCISPIIYIPSSVTTIGHHAFYSCSSITVVYMGAESEDDYEAGDNWLPKSLSVAFINVAPDPEYGKTLEDAQAEKERLDNLSAEEE
ncbi:MAG: leucine-rich repeat domain-containing protein [Clostridiales bacterium]|nr:leucine-rich repeat domain-containing protein [Clostridiales bacterium]